MTVARLAISLDAELARAVRKAAGRQPTSAWLAEAAEQRLRNEGLRRAVGAYEDRFGSFTEKELEDVARREGRAVASAKRAPKRRRRATDAPA